MLPPHKTFFIYGLDNQRVGQDCDRRDFCQDRISGNFLTKDCENLDNNFFPKSIDLFCTPCYNKYNERGKERNTKMMKVRIYNDKLEMLEVTFNSVAEAESLEHYLDFLGAKYEEEITE